MSTPSEPMTAEQLAPPAAVAGMGRKAMQLAGAGIALSLVAHFLTPGHFLRAYLVGYMFCLGLTLGSMTLLMLGHLTGGNWWMIGRRPMEAAMKTLPLMLVLFAPIALGMKSLYIWTNSELAQHDAVIRAKAAYLNLNGWLLRAVFFLVLWNLLALFLGLGSARQDRDASPAVWRRLKAVAAPGLVLYALSVTLAVVDWVMSLDPHWYSTIFGLIFIIGQLLSAMAFLILLLVALSKYAPIREVLRPDRLHDLGKLMLAFTMVWAYFSFSQWLIIWMGNLPEEISWYLDRIRGGWEIVALSLVLLQFALPFTLLLSRDLKRDARKLVPVALLVLLMRWADLFWLVAPNPFPGARMHSIQFNLSYIAVPMALLGVWLTVFFWNLRQRPLLVVTEPMLPRLWEESHGH